MQTTERPIEFTSCGVTCRGLFVRPADDRQAPLVVLAHGLGGVYEMGLDTYARRFAQAGYAALTFDYRSFGRSDGLPRQVLRRRAQQLDIETAVEFGKTLEGVDPTRVVLWGTSLAGGHVADIASRRDDLTAAIIQAPFTDGLASARATSPLSGLGSVFFGLGDMLSRLMRRGPVLVPLAAPPHYPALMTKPDVIEGVMALLPPGSRLSGRLSHLYREHAEGKIELPSEVSTSELTESFADGDFVGSLVFPSGTTLLNGVSANFGLDILTWRPGKNLARARCPVLVCVCEGDSVAPPGPTLDHAQRAPRCEVATYPYGHFEIYTGAPFEEVTRDQLDFLQRLAPRDVDERERTTDTATP